MYYFKRSEIGQSNPTIFIKIVRKIEKLCKYQSDYILRQFFSQEI